MMKSTRTTTTTPRLVVAAFVSAVFSFALVSPVSAGDDLELLNKAYQREIEKVTEPVTARYLEALGKMKERMVRDGDVHGALEVEQAIAVMFLDGSEWKWDNTGKDLPFADVTGSVKFSKNGTLVNHKGAETTWTYTNGKLKFWGTEYVLKNGVWHGLAEGRRKNYLYPATMKARDDNKAVSIFLESLGAN